MEYYIKHLNRKILLDDVIVSQYLKLESELRDAPFIISLYSVYEDEEIKNLSDDDLSRFCNEVLLDEIQVDLDLPNVIETIVKNKDKFETASKNSELLECNIEMGE